MNMGRCEKMRWTRLQHFSLTFRSFCTSKAASTTNATQVSALFRKVWRGLQGNGHAQSQHLLRP